MVCPRNFFAWGMRYVRSPPCTFLHTNIQHSTFHHSLKRTVPLSLQNGKCTACFPFVHLCPSCPFNIYRNIFRFIPAICKDCTVSRIQPGFLPTYEPWLIPTCESSDSHRQRTTFAALRSPFLSRKELRFPS